MWKIFMSNGGVNNCRASSDNLLWVDILCIEISDLSDVVAARDCRTNDQSNDPRRHPRCRPC